MQELQKTIGYRFRSLSLLRQALTHSSYSNEHGSDRMTSNERLEFLGDAVLELPTSEYLYNHYPELTEGELSKLRASIVCEPTLADVAERIGLPSRILLGRGEEATGGRKRPSIVSDALEAVIGAIYLDGGFLQAREFVWKFVMADLEHRKLFYDSKTILQETAKHLELGSVAYELLGTEGPDHARVFNCAVRLGGKLYGQGKGHNKKMAEQSAAYQAILRIRQNQAEGREETECI